MGGGGGVLSVVFVSTCVHLVGSDVCLAVREDHIIMSPHTHTHTHTHTQFIRITSSTEI